MAALVTDNADACLATQARCFESESVGSRRLDCFTLFADQECVKVGVWMACFDGMFAEVAPLLRASCLDPLDAAEDLGLDFSPSASINTLLRRGLDLPACRAVFGRD